MRLFCVFVFYAFNFSCSLMGALKIPIEIEFALTKDQRAWGLMRRTNLPENHGMLFYHPKKIWMFNTWIDLSAAFLDDQGIIMEIVELKAYPEKMDPKRPVNTLSDIRKYLPNDKIYIFFMQQGKVLPSGIYYVVEMNKGWFAKNGVKPGDRISWSLNSSRAYIELLNFER